MLRPATVIIYDDLAADHAATWSWLLHSPNQISKNASGMQLTNFGSTARTQTDLFAPTELQVTISDQFDPPAVNWRDKTSGGAVIQYPNQWHVTAKPTERQASTRFLAVIQVASANTSTSYSKPIRAADGRIDLGQWRVTAALDPAEAPRLLITRADGKTALAVDCAEFDVGNTHYKSSGSESVLVEDAIGPARRCTDSPQHVREPFTGPQRANRRERTAESEPQMNADKRGFQKREP